MFERAVLDIVILGYMDFELILVHDFGPGFSLSVWARANIICVGCVLELASMYEINKSSQLYVILEIGMLVFKCECVSVGNCPGPCSLCAHIHHTGYVACTSTQFSFYPKPYTLGILKPFYGATAQDSIPCVHTYTAQGISRTLLLNGALVRPSFVGPPYRFPSSVCVIITLRMLLFKGKIVELY